MKQTALSLCLFLASVTSASAEVRISTLANTPDAKQNGLELITDPTFSAGFAAIPACDKPDTDKACAAGDRYNLKSPAYPENASAQPAWSLAQWGSRTNLKGAPQPYGSGYGWATETKRLTIYPDGTVEMAIDGAKELNGTYLTERTSWPSLIASETIAAPGAYSRDIGNLTTISKLQLSLDFRLLYGNIGIQNGYDRDRDALIFPINVIVQNLNQESAGYGEFIWLQAVAYDDRYASPDEASDRNLIDVGTKKMIYFVPKNALTTDNVHEKHWVTFNGDILPYAKRAVQLAFEKGLLKSQAPTDYSIGGITIGYEITGMNVAAFQFRSLSLRALY